MSKLRVIRTAVFWLVSPLVVPALASAMIVEDGEFLDESWSVIEVADTTPGDTFVFSGSMQLEGGNPGAWRFITHESSSPVGTGVQLISGHLFDPFAWDPAQDGAIASIDLSIDGRSDGSTAGAVGYALLARQAGVVYLASLGQVLNGAGWQTLGATGLLATDLVAQVGGAPLLDFSAAGGPIEFGFGASNGTFGESLNFGGVDNWRLTLNLVPEPLAVWMLLLATGAAIASRRAP